VFDNRPDFPALVFTVIGLERRFIDHSQAVTTNNYNSITDFHITNHPILSFSVYFYQSYLSNSFSQWLSLCSVFTRRFLVTKLSNGDSYAPVAR
jgi:hypothetical protein